MGDAVERRTTELVDAFLAGRMSRRTFIRSLLALGLTAGTAGAILANTARTRAQVGSDVAGTVRFYIGPWTADEVANHEVIAEGFRTLYPNVDFTFDLYDWGTQSEQTNASLAEGAHDIYYFGEAQLVSRLEQEDGFEDITARIDDPAFADEKAKYLYWDRIDRYGPKLIGLPISWHVEDGLFVNLEKLAEAGYGPEFVDSWDSFVDAVTKMTNGSETYGAGLGMQINGFGEWYQRLRSGGGSYLTPDLTAPNVVKPEVVEATQQMADLFANGYAPPLGTFDYNTGPGAFAGGRLATYSSDMTVAPWLASMDPAVPFEWSVVPMPPGPVDRLQFNDIGFYAMGSRTPDKDLAWEVLKWWTNPDNGAFWTGKSGTYSARADALEHGYADYAVPQAAAAFEQFAAQGVGPEPFKGFQQVEDQAEAQVKRVYAGEIGVEEALANIEAIVVADVLS